MWPVSDRFLTALGGPHRYKTTVTITPPGGDPVEVPFRAGSVQVDGSQRIRRRIQGLELVGDSTVFELAVTPGALFQIEHGLSFGTTSELVPVFTGEAAQGTQRFADGGITLTVADQGNTLAACPLPSPFAPAASTTRVDAIQTVVEAAIPNVEVVNESSDAGTIGSAQVWTDKPGDVISALTKDGATEGFFRPDGVFLIKDAPTSSTPPVWSITSGEGGTLKQAERTRPLDKLINRVVVAPSSQDQTWTEQAAEITDTGSPLHSSKIGVRTYRHQSQTIASAVEALGIANRLLDRYQGVTETLSLTSIANPALEVNDSIRVITPRLNQEPPRIFQHFIDQYTLNLATGEMTLQTRSQVVTDE